MCRGRGITCKVYPGSHWKDTTLFIWRRSPTLMLFMGTTGSAQLVRDTAKEQQTNEEYLITIEKQKGVKYRREDI